MSEPHPIVRMTYFVPMTGEMILDAAGTRDWIERRKRWWAFWSWAATAPLRWPE